MSTEAYLHPWMAENPGLISYVNSPEALNFLQIQGRRTPTFNANYFNRVLDHAGVALVAADAIATSAATLSRRRTLAGFLAGLGGLTAGPLIADAAPASEITGSTVAKYIPTIFPWWIPYSSRAAGGSNAIRWVGDQNGAAASHDIVFQDIYHQPGRALGSINKIASDALSRHPDNWSFFGECSGLTHSAILRPTPPDGTVSFHGALVNLQTRVETGVILHDSDQLWLYGNRSTGFDSQWKYFRDSLEPFATYMDLGKDGMWTGVVVAEDGGSMWVSYPPSRGYIRVNKLVMLEAYKPVHVSRYVIKEPHVIEPPVVKYIDDAQKAEAAMGIIDGLDEGVSVGIMTNTEITP